MTSSMRIERRHFLLAAIALAHAALILLLLTQRAPFHMPSRDASGGLSVFDVAATETAPSRTPAEPVEVEVPVPLVQLDVESPIRTVADQPLAPSGSSGIACDLTEVLQSELPDNDNARAALSLIPAEARSVANAVMLWDGRWVDARLIGGDAALAPLRAAISVIVERAPHECRAREEVGPRLLFVPSGQKTVTLVLGSGSWRWIDLIDARDLGVGSPNPPAGGDIARD